jgi:hypothetical protein
LLWASFILISLVGRQISAVRTNDLNSGRTECQ